MGHFELRDGFVPRHDGNFGRVPLDVALSFHNTNQERENNTNFKKDTKMIEFIIPIFIFRTTILLQKP